MRSGVKADVGRAIAMAAGGAAAFAPVEYVLTLATYSGPVTIWSKLRLVALVLTLSLWLWAALVVVLGISMIGARLVRTRLDPATARGWFVEAPVERGIRRGVPRLWATVATVMFMLLAIQRGGAWALATYKEPQLTAALVATIAVAVAGLAVPLHRVLAVTFTGAAEGLAPILGPANTLGRWRAAGVALAALAGGALAAVWFAVPQSRSVLPVRLAISALTIGLGMGVGAGYLVRLPRPRAAAKWIAAFAFALVTTTLVWFGAELETRYVAVTASPALEKLIGFVRFTNDLDRDGFGSVLGENDCKPFDRAINPGANDKPTDDIDQDCDGKPLKWISLVAPPGPKKPVPKEFQKDWNFLLITIDTVRYDRTSFGGYLAKTKRDTTPRLAELVAQSTSYRFAQAPAPGTMASIPAIITSKFFHSGLAIQDRPGGIPPKLMQENTTLAEILKRKNYYTGAIGSHDWWNDWGFDQGVDDYDNSIGKVHTAFTSSAHKVTDKVLAWISRQQNKKWFLWAHYIDPHGRYVAHPDVVDYGTSEPDLYDAEIQWTDQQLGRLLDELKRLPSKQNTIIIITSDHGDSMGEHATVPVGTHGVALYGELLHVPMIFFIPGNRPHFVDGATSPLDIVPTIADLAGIDVHDLEFEGKSQVGSLFYGLEDHDRVVFAETNAPGRQRAAISDSWKIIYYMKTNIYELFDLKVDPYEQKNLAPMAPPAFAKMKGTLQLWINRVVNARDPKFNQAFRQIQDVVLAEAPKPVVPTTGQTIDGIEVLGTGAADRLVAGKPSDVFVYFHVTAATTTVYKLGLVVWPAGTDTTGPKATVSPRPTADGAFATDQWKAGDHIRERFTVNIPVGWTGAVNVGLVVQGLDGVKRKASGVAPAADQTIAILGTLTIGP